MSAINKILSPNKVREMMAKMQAEIESKEPQLPPARSKEGKVARACEMIQKTSCSIASAAQSWGVKTKSIISYAKDNGIKIHNKPDDLERKAKEIVVNKTYMSGVPRGLKQRVAYELSLKFGISKACRMLGVCRRGLYYYCERYNLPTPNRNERRYEQEGQQ